MNYKTLWEQSSLRLQYPTTYSNKQTSKFFTNGARWMHIQLDNIRNTNTSFCEETNFGLYGFMKYGICVTASSLSAFLLYRVHPSLLPVTLLVFYFCEVQLLFLFPLLIDKVPQPIASSIRLTESVGSIKAMSIIIPVGIRMLVGLLNVKAPLRNWYIGCLAVLIWYDNEIRNR